MEGRTVFVSRILNVVNIDADYTHAICPGFFDFIAHPRPSRSFRPDENDYAVSVPHTGIYPLLNPASHLLSFLPFIPWQEEVALDYSHCSNLFCPIDVTLEVKTEEYLRLSHESIFRISIQEGN